jgi:hypothetical protein
MSTAQIEGMLRTENLSVGRTIFLRGTVIKMRASMTYLTVGNNLDLMTQRCTVEWPTSKPRSAIISSRFRRLSEHATYQRTHKNYIPRIVQSLQHLGDAREQSLAQRLRRLGHRGRQQFPSAEFYFNALLR